MKSIGLLTFFRRNLISRWKDKSWVTLPVFYLISSLTFAQPQDLTIVSGQATLTVDQNTLQIHAQDKTIVNWKEFSIAENETTRFIQPDKKSVILNRVLGKNQSLIDGKLLANGKVYLVNQNGVIIGSKGVVDTAGFIASSLDLLDNDFLQKGELLFSGESKAQIQNFGSVEANGGDVVFIGYFVENQGTIRALDGAAILAAGREVLLKLEGDESIAVHPQKGLITTSGVGIQNSGDIEAIRAELKADGNLYALAINHSGSIQALGVIEKEGRVLLVADQGEATIHGNISAKNDNGLGGEVHLLGRTVNLIDKAYVDVSGELGGGTVLVGGDFQGRNPSIINADYSFVGKDVQLDANAFERGNGGRLIVWADKNTHFHGVIEAKGGFEEGNGGFTEISGKELLDFTGKVNLTAMHGEVGTLLLDPTDLVISAATPTANVSYPSPLIEPNAQVPISFLLFSDLQTQLGLSNVTVQTLPDTVTPASSAGDITWEDGANVLNPSATTSLTINAYRDFNMGSNYNNVGTGTFIANAGRDINFLNLAAALSSAGFTGNNSNATVIAARDINLIAVNQAISLGGRNVTLQAGGNFKAQAGSSGAGNDIDISAVQNISIVAGGAISCLGGAGPSSQVSMNSVNLNLTANQGDISFIAGSAGAGLAGVHLLAGIDLEIQALDGNLILQGSSDNITVVSAQNLNAFVAQDCFITGGNGTATSAAIATLLISPTPNPMNIKIGGNCILQGGTNAASLATPAAALIEGFNGVNLSVGKNLTLFGGGNFGVASVTSISGDINLNVGSNLTLNGGQGTDAFAQIGGSYLGTANINININSLGGDLILNGSTTGGVTGAYALIGNGGQTTVPGPSSGNILISGAPGAQVIITGGTGSSNYAQIGHPNLTSNAITGDIRLSNIGNNVKLTSNGNYALIGHGTDIFSAPSITGSITLDAIGGDVSLTAMGGGEFLQIGHVNCQGLTQGDVFVNAPNGTVSLLPSPAGGGSCIIGHGNALTTSGNPQFQGQITVNANEVNLQGGLSQIADAVIGFACNFNFGGPLIILPTSGVAVTAEKNILVQGGNAIGGSPQANGIIGFFSTASLNNSNITLNDLHVTSRSGDITLIGNLGTAFIGTRDTNFIPNTTTQSNITILAPQGTVSLTPSVFGGTAGTGHAIIANSNASFSPNFVTPIYNIGITAGRLMLTGSPVGSQTSGTAEIFSIHNVDVHTVSDLTMVIPPFTTTTCSCNISSGDSVMTFDIGSNLEMMGGNTVGSFVQIGTNVVVPGERDILFKNIGGNAFLQGGTNTQCYAQIGNSSGGVLIPVVGNILIDHIGGALTLTGASTSLSQSVQGSFALIGHNLSPFVGGGQVTLTGDVRVNRVDGPITLTSGSDTQTYALIGHSLSQTTNSSCSGEIFVEGASIILSGTTVTNTNFTPDNATIGFELGLANSPTVTSTQIHAIASDELTLSSGYAGNFPNTGGDATIGVHASSNATTANIKIDKLSVSSPSGDITLKMGNITPGSFIGNAVIGYFHPFTNTSETVTFQNIQVRSELGNVTLFGGTTQPPLGTSFIGTQSNSSINNTLAVSNIAVQAPQGTLILSGIPPVTTFSVGQATISNATNTTTTPANYDITIDVATLSMSGTPQGVGNFGHATIFSNRNLDLSTKNDLLLIAGNGFATISAFGIMTFDIGSNVELFGGSSAVLGPNQFSIAQIGNSTSTTSTNLVTGDIIFKNIGANCTLNGGTVTNSFARIGHGNPASNQNITGEINIDHIGGNLTLNGGSDTGATSFAQIGHYGADQNTTPFPSTIGDVIINECDGVIQLVSGIIGHAGGTTQGTFSGEILVEGNSISLLGNGTTNKGVTTFGNSTIGFDLLSNPILNSNQIQVSAINGLFLTGGDAGTAPPTVQGEATIGVRGNLRATLDNLSVSSTNGDIVLTAGSPTASANAGGNAIIGQYNVLASPFNSVTIDNLSVNTTFGNILLVGGKNDTNNLNAGTSVIGTFTNANAVSQSQISINAGGNLNLSSLPSTLNVNITEGNALVVNNFQGQLAPFDVSMSLGSLTMVGIPSGVTNSGKQAAIYSSRNTTLQTKGDLLMNPGGALTNNTPTTISNGSGVMTFDIGGNVVLNAGFSVAQIGNALTNGQSDILFKNIGGNLFLTGGSANLPTPSYAQIGHGSLVTTSTSSQNVQGQIEIDFIGGDLTLTGGSGIGFAYAQIGHADNGVGGTSTTLQGDVIISNVQGGVNLISGSGNGLAALIGHSGASSSNQNVYSGKIIVGGNTFKLQTSDASTTSTSVTIGYEVFNSNATVNSDQIQVSATNGITLTGGNALGGSPSFADATIGFHNGLTATIKKLGVSSANGDISLTAGVPGNTGNQGGNAVIGYYNHVTSSPAKVVIQDIQVDTLSGNINLTGGSGTQSITPTPTGVAFIGTSTTSTNNTLAASNIAIQAPRGSLNLSGAPFQNNTTNFGLALIANLTNQAIPFVPPNFDISIDVGRLILTGTFQGAIASQFASATIISARNLDVRSAGDLLLVSGTGFANIQTGSGIMTFDIGGNVELLGGFTTAGGANPSAQIGNPIGTFAFTNNIIFKNIKGDLTVTSGTGGGAGYARIGHGGPGAQAIAGQIVIDQIGGNLTINSINNLAQIGHFGGNGTTTGDLVINGISGIAQINGGIIGQTGGLGSNFSGQILLQGNAFTLQNGTSTIGFDVNGTVISTQIVVSALNDITLTGSNGVDATIGVRTANSGSSVEKLAVLSTNGDIILTAGTPSGGIGGNAILGYFNTGALSVVIDDLSVSSTGGDITLMGSSTGGTAFVGTQNAAGVTQSQILINAPLGILSLTGANGTSSGKALIANSSLFSLDPVDVSLNVNRMILTGSTTAGAVQGAATIFSSRNIDFISQGDLLLNAGFGLANIQNAAGVMTFDVGGNLELLGGSSLNSSAQIGIPLNTNTGQSNIIVKEVKGNIALNGGTGQNGFARIGHGSTGSTQAINGQIVVNQVSGNLTLAGGNGGTGSYGQIGHYGADTSPALTNGDVIVNNVGGYIQLTPGPNTQSSALIGHAGGANGGSFTGQVIVQGSSVNLLGNTVSASAANSTVGFSLNAGVSATVNSSQIQVLASEGITLAGGVSNASGGNATIGFNNVITGSIGKLNVTSLNGDITLNAGTPGAGNGGNAVIGFFNPASAATITMNDISVSSSQGSISLIGGVGGATNGTAFIGTFGANANAESQILINTPNGMLNLYGLPVGSTTVAGGRASIANVAVGSSVPFDISINVNKALLVGAPVGTVQTGNAQVYSGRNFNFSSVGDLILAANSGTSSIGGGNGRMTFNVGANLQLIAGGGATSIAQIGNNNPLAGVTNIIVFNNIGGNTLVQGGTSAGSHALIGHFETAGGAPLGGDVIISAMGGDLTIVGGTVADALAQVGHFSQTTSTVIGDVTVNNVKGSISLIGGLAAHTSSVIGHGGKGTSHTYTGQVIVQGNRVNIQGGAGAGGPATIGFEDSSTAPTINSTQVQVSAPTAITLNAGTGSNATVGYFNASATGNVIIDNVNVLSTNGDIILNAGVGAAAVIGTQLATGVSRSNIKVTTRANILLQNPPGSSGSALIVNNRIGASGSTNISLDPSDIILLSGVGGTPGIAQIYSGNNIDLNFTNRFDLNFDANNPVTLQTGTAQVLASGDIRINTDQTSLGNITFQGTSNNQLTQIDSFAGNVLIGTPEAVGAQSLILGTGAAGVVGVVRILAQGGDVSIYTLKNVNLTGGANNAAQITAGGEIAINSGRDLTLGSNSLIQNLSSFPLNIVTANDVNLNAPTASASILSPGSLSISAGRDLNLATNAVVQSSGTFPLQATAGNNVNISSNANLSQTGGGELTAVANKNMVLTGSAVVSTVNTNLTLVVDNQWPDPDKFGTGFFSLAGGVTVSAGSGRLRVFTARRPLNTITGNLNGVPFVPGTIYVNTPTEQWLTYWDSSFGDPPLAYTVFYKDTTPPTGPVDCVNICNFPPCVNLCNPPPPPPPPPSPSPPQAMNRRLTDKLILEDFDPAFFEAFQDWRTYDYFLFTPLPLLLSANCCDYLNQLGIYRDKKECEKMLAILRPFGPSLSCQEGMEGDLGVLRPEHRNYHTKKLEIIRY